MKSELLQNSKPTTAFLHFFDVHFLELKQAHLLQKEIEQEARIATRFALLYADEILIPAASYFETHLCRQLILELNSLFKYGIIWLVGGAANTKEFIFNKLSQYDVKSLQYQMYSEANLEELPPFRTRYQSATKDIKTDWMRRLHERKKIIGIYEGTGFTLPKDFERRWERVPDSLEEKAFIVPYVAPLLLKDDKHPTIINRLHYVINEAYFSSYVNEFQACTVDDMIYLGSSNIIPSIGPRIPFRKILNEARKNKILGDIIKCNSEDLLELKEDDRWIRCVIAVTCNQQTIDEQIATRIVEKKERKKTMDSLRSFIVHGHDEVSKLGLKDYLQNTLSLPQPTILHQQPNKGRTTIEKFEAYSQDIDVVFVLLTPDDIGGLPEGEQRERARQNVIFELGFFLGRFGRLSGRVILLYKENLEIPSDLAGIVYIDISNGIEAAGEEIRKELMEIGSNCD